MLFATRSVMVNAPVEAIWSTLVDKAEHPEKYMPYQARDSENPRDLPERTPA